MDERDVTVRAGARFAIDELGLVSCQLVQCAG
jgi:hypothetical protein